MTPKAEKINANLAAKHKASEVAAIQEEQAILVSNPEWGNQRFLTREIVRQLSSDYLRIAMDVEDFKGAKNYMANFELSEELQESSIKKVFEIGMDFAAFLCEKNEKDEYNITSEAALERAINDVDKIKGLAQSKDENNFLFCVFCVGLSHGVNVFRWEFKDISAEGQNKIFMERVVVGSGLDKEDINYFVDGLSGVYMYDLINKCDQFAEIDSETRAKKLGVVEIKPVEPVLWKKAKP